MEKIKAGYRREMNHNYMIIEALNDDSECYESRMLSGNMIDGLLRFRQKETETGLKFYYEITSKQPLSRLLEGKLISYEEIRELLLSASRTLGRIEEFLLKEEQIILEPEFIYVEPEPFSVFFCILPGYSRSFPEAFTDLLQYILEKVDHQDHRSVVLAYGLYHESLKENYGMGDLLRYLSSIESGMAEKKGKQPPRDETIWQKEQEPFFLPEESDDSDDRREKKEMGFSSFREQGTSVSEDISDKKERLIQEKKRTFGIFKTAGLLFTAEALIYFFLGTAGIRAYGLFPVFAAAGGYLILTAVQMLTASNYEENETEVKVEPVSKEEENLNILFQSLDDDTSLEATKEPVWEDRNTQLLTGAVENEKRGAALESLSKDRADIEIPYVPFLIGKHREMNDFILDCPTVSRMHLRIDQKEKVYIFTDMNSTNGTVVNGYKLEANETVSVKEGDSIQIAGLSYRFREFT